MLVKELLILLLRVFRGLLGLSCNIAPHISGHHISEVINKFSKADCNTYLDLRLRLYFSLYQEIYIS
jgi:hypothetical protein